MTDHSQHANFLDRFLGDDAGMPQFNLSAKTDFGAVAGLAKPSVRLTNSFTFG